MGTAYKDFLAQLMPSWLRGTSGADDFHAGKGDVKDALVDMAKDAVYARMPLVAPTDALELLGAERGLPRGIAEADSAFAQRLQAAWTTWQNAGTALGVLSALKAGGFTAAIVQQRKLGFTLDATGALVMTALGGGGWTFDSTTLWTRFAVLLLAPLPVSWLTVGGSASYIWLSSTGVLSTVLTAATQLTQDVRIMLWVTTAGTTTGTAQVRYSLDNGVTFSAAMSFASMVAALAPYTALTVASTTVALNDIAYVSPTFSIPADGSAASLYVKGLVNPWKPAFASVTRYVISTRGQLVGWPVRALGGGTAGGAPLRLGGGLTTAWGP